MPVTFQSLPYAIQEIVTSTDYTRFLFYLRDRFALSLDQENGLDKIVVDLLSRAIDPSNLRQSIVEHINVNEEDARELEKELLLNIVLPFADYFGDYISHYRSLGGDEEKDLARSPIMLALFKKINELLEEKLAPVMLFDWGKEADAMRTLFAKELVENYYAPDGDYKVRLNETILALLRTYDAYNEKLLGALYENVQEIGSAEITLPDNTHQWPTVANWIKDFLGFSGGTISSIMLAKYVSQNKNVSSLQERDKDAVRRLLETFVVLKNFPDSLNSIPEDQWKIIPYYHTEEISKLPQAQRAGSDTPTPTITIVPAPEPTAPIDFSPLTDAVIVKTGAILQETARERVKKILETRVRNVRNDIDTRARLMAPVGEGGAGLGAEEAEKMLAEAKNAQQMIAEGKLDEYAPKKVDEKGVDNVSLDSRLRGNDRESGDAVAPKMVIKEVDGVPTLVEKTEKKGNGKKSEEEKVHEVPHEAPHEIPPPPTVKVPQHLEDAKVIPVVVKTSGAGLDPDRSLSRVSPRDRDDKAVGVEKKPIPDVKALPRLVTVVDELRALSMKDIRRISQDTKVACQKIADKINVLAKESLSKRAEAINAWKESPAYALYLEIGQLNISQDMGTLAEERKKAGKEYLTAEEFDALLDLNEKLRF